MRLLLSSTWARHRHIHFKFNSKTNALHLQFLHFNICIRCILFCFTLLWSVLFLSVCQHILDSLECYSWLFVHVINCVSTKQWALISPLTVRYTYLLMNATGLCSMHINHIHIYLPHYQQFSNGFPSACSMLMGFMFGWIILCTRCVNQHVTHIYPLGKIIT